MIAKTVIFVNGQTIRVVKGRSRKDVKEVRIIVGGRLIGRVIYDPSTSPVNSPAWIELFDGIEVQT